MNTKKYFFIFTFFLALLLSFPSSVSASEEETISIIITLTEENSNYDCGTSDIIILSLEDSTLSITKTLRYHGNVFPAAQISHSQTVDGITYSGTLNLTGYTYRKETDQTIATYKGILSAVN